MRPQRLRRLTVVLPPAATRQHHPAARKTAKGLVRARTEALTSRSKMAVVN